MKGWTIGSTAIYNGKPSLSDEASGIYIGVDGISIRRGGNYIRLSGDDGSLTANNATITGTINATGGSIGGCSIKDGKLEVSSAHIYGTIVADAINLNTADISGTLSASYISGGTIDADTINVKNLNAANLSKGFINAARLSDENNRLDYLYAKDLNYTTLRGTTMYCGGTLRLGGVSNSVHMGGAGIRLTDDGTLYTWESIVAGATTETKTAVFG